MERMLKNKSSQKRKLTIHNPWHLINQNIIQRIRIVIFECVNYDFCVLQINVAQASIE